MKKIILILIILFVVLTIAFRICCGVFVIQPIGALPEGKTILYWRVGLDYPFITSADGALEKSGTGVSLFGRSLMLSRIIDDIDERIILRMKYSEKLYLKSTGGIKYEK
jgi:hypothetical protein